jgi:hypothetical protein
LYENYQNNQFSRRNIYVPDFFSVGLYLLRHGCGTKVEDLKTSFLRSKDHVAVTGNKEAAQAVTAPDGTNAGLKKNNREINLPGFK